jgi:hypothetical protein
MAKRREKFAQTSDCIKGNVKATATSTDGLVAWLCLLIGSQKQQLNKLFSLVLVSFVTVCLQFVTLVKIANIWGKAASL